MPFSRAHLKIDSERCRLNAAALAAALKAGTPSIRVMEHDLKDGVLILELVPLTAEEVDIVGSRLESVLS